MKRKWYYRIYAMIGGKRHLIWQYSKHYFQDDISKKDHKKLNKKGYTYDEHVGIEHRAHQNGVSQTNTIKRPVNLA